MKRSTVNKIIDICPDFRLMKKALSAVRMKRIRGHYIPTTDVIAGESNDEDKKRIVEKYTAEHRNELRSTYEMMDHIFKHAPQYRKRVNDDKLRTDLLFCRMAYGFQPDEYLCFDLEHQSYEERRNWISDWDRYIYIHSVNDVKDAQIFNNKVRTYEMFAPYYKRAAIGIKTKKDFQAFKRFTNEYPQFVKKQVYEGMGRSVELMDLKQISALELFQDLIAKGEHIIEERIVQSNVMSELNPSSVNTVRCITINTKKGIKTPFCFLKVGRNGSFVDNGGAGGILTGIDPESGIVVTHGYDEFHREYVSHPETGILFKGFKLPQWDEMKRICREMAHKVPSVKCIGWDMAFTDQGWIIVEGNGMTQFIVPQIVFQRGIKQEVEEILQNVERIVT